MSKKIFVIGAGIIGVTTAIRLAEAGWNVTVFHNSDSYENFVSDKAAAFWFPFAVDVSDNKVQRWSKGSSQ